jgi:hypothetical protein
MDEFYDASGQQLSVIHDAAERLPASYRYGATG